MKLSQIAFVITIMSFTIIVMMFAHHEPTESWGLWLFTRIFSEGGGFIIPERSPLYTLYLLIFYWIGYPGSMISEWFITSLIVAVVFFFFIKPYLGTKLSIFATVLWLPFIRFSPPAVQDLALACSCLAIIVRRNSNEDNAKFRWALSYALFGFAYLFRTTYFFCIVLFAGYDLLRLYKKGGLKQCGMILFPRMSYWPIGVFLALVVLFSVMQSSHHWNNAWYCSTTWFPTEGKTLRDASFMQTFNWEYIRLKYGTFEGHDFYFSNQEAFKGASTMWGGILANPQFVIEQWGRNILKLLEVSTFFIPVNWLGRLFLPLALSMSIIAIAALFGAFRAVKKNMDMLLFLTASVMILGAMSLSMPKLRYMVPIAPILVMSAWWYGLQLRDKLIPIVFKNQRNVIWSGLIGIVGILVVLTIGMLLGKSFPLWKYSSILLVLLLLIFIIASKIKFQLKINQWLANLAKVVAIPLMLIFFARPYLWGKVVKDISAGELRIMENRSSTSWENTYQNIEQLIKNCKGVMTAEYRFMGAFSHLPVNKIYDVWEIPPFGRLGDSPYDGLRPERIDCLMVSDNLAYGGYGTPNERLRYQFYIKPYVERLQEMGAATYDIPKYGKAIILNKRNLPKTD